MSPRKTLREILDDPAMPARIERAAKKLDAQDAGWVVLDSKEHKAREAVTRAARKVSVTEEVAGYDEWQASLSAMRRALARLDRLTKGGER